LFLIYNPKFYYAILLNKLPVYEVFVLAQLVTTVRNKYVISAKKNALG